VGYLLIDVFLVETVQGGSAGAKWTGSSTRQSIGVFEHASTALDLVSLRDSSSARRSI